MKLIVICTFLFMAGNSFGQEQTFTQNEEKARVNESRFNLKSNRYIFTLKEGVISEDLFNQLVAAMDSKDGYVSIQMNQSDLIIVAEHFITSADVSGVIDQFGQTFIEKNVMAISLMKK